MKLDELDSSREDESIHSPGKFGDRRLSHAVSSNMPHVDGTCLHIVMEFAECGDLQGLLNN